MSESPEGASGAGAPRSADLATGIIIAVVAIAAIVVSRDFPTTGLDTDVGPARFPLIYAGMLVVLSAILVIGRLLPGRNGKDHGGEPAPAGSAFRFGPVAAGVAATAAYIHLITLVGYIPTTIVFLIGMMRLMGQRGRVRGPLIAVGITAFLYLVFLYGLQIPLPMGSLFDPSELS